MNDLQDPFLCGLLVIDSNKSIVKANQYFSDNLQWSEHALEGATLDTLLTKSSSIFYESYVLPILLSDGYLQEVELTVFTGTKVRVPMVASVRYDKVNSKQYWCFQNASNRHKLYDELIQVRETLVAQNEELKLLSNTDMLTGLLNRREFSNSIERVLLRFSRYKGDLSLMMLDIDNFKLINDNYGHDKGDEVLAEIGKILTKQTRETDVVARFGGEEFAILMPDVGSQDSLHLSERLHKSINALVLDNKAITMSIGISDISLCEEVSYEALFKQADSALYAAKHSGKNKTVVFTANIDNG